MKTTYLRHTNGDTVQRMGAEMKIYVKLGHKLGPAVNLAHSVNLVKPWACPINQEVEVMAISSPQLQSDYSIMFYYIALIRLAIARSGKHGTQSLEHGWVGYISLN